MSLTLFPKYRAATYVSGIKISRNKNLKQLYLDQENYLEIILKRFNMDKYKPLNTPNSKCQYLSKKMCPQNEIEIQEVEYVPLYPSSGQSHVYNEKYKT
jgi:hypothetical protein